jgi:hypothetical protein
MVWVTGYSTAAGARGTILEQVHMEKSNQTGHGRGLESARRLLARAPRITVFLELALVFGVVVVVWWPFLHSARVNNHASDWNYRTDYTGYTLHAIFDEREFPFWVTSRRFEQLRVKGVHDFFANPETDVLSPLTLLARPFGYFAALKITLLLYLAVGVYGCRCLLRAFGTRASPLATLLLALLGFCNGGFVAHVLTGHIQFLTLLILPLALAFFLKAWSTRAPRDSRLLYAAWAGAVLAAAFYAGNTHPLVHFFFIFFGLFTLLSLLTQPWLWSTALPAAALASLSFAALAAFKLLPSLADFQQYQANYVIRFAGWSDLVHNLTTPWRLMTGDNPPEHNLYIGWVGLAVLAFCVTGWNRRTFPLLVITFVVPWLTFILPGSRLLAFPFLRTQGALTRLAMSALFAPALAAAVRVDQLLAWSRRRARCGVAVASLVCLVAVYLAFDLSRANLGGGVAVSCVHPVPKSLGPFSVAPTFVVERNSNRATVTPSNVTANRFSYHFSQVDSSDATLLVAPELAVVPRMPHLKLEGDGELTASGGVLAVRVRGKNGTFTLHFFDKLVWWGLATTVAASLALVAWWVSASRFRRRARPIGRLKLRPCDQAQTATAAPLVGCASDPIRSARPGDAL